MEEEYLKALKAKLLNGRYSEALDFLRQDLQQMKEAGYSYDLLVIFVESKFGIRFENREKFRYNMRKRFYYWRKSDKRPAIRKEADTGYWEEKRKNEARQKSGIPEFLRYDRSMEPPEEDIFESVRKEIELREREKKNRLK